MSQCSSRWTRTVRPLSSSTRYGTKQAAPTLTIDEKAWLYIDGRQTNTSTVSRAASQEAIAQRLRDAPADSVTWVHKGRFAFSDDAATKATKAASASSMRPGLIVCDVSSGTKTSPFFAY